MSYSQLQNKCCLGIFKHFLPPLVICSSWIPLWRYHLAMWGEITSGNERCSPLVNHLWWKSWRTWSPSAIWTFWSVLNMKGLSTCLILLDLKAILIGGCKKIMPVYFKENYFIALSIFHLWRWEKWSKVILLFCCTGVESLHFPFKK